MAMIFAGAGCVDPAGLAEELAARGVPADRWRARAGLYRTGPGAAPGRGWVLLKKSDLDAIDAATDHDLVISGSNAAHVLTLSPITLLHVECVDPGSATDPVATFLCEVVDRRHLLGRIPLDKAYNLTKSDGSGNFTQTENSGSPWTWQEVVQDIATALALGTLTLPFTPDAAPNNLVYWGHPSALACLCDVLTRIGCDLAYDPVADEFSVVRLGAAQDTALAAVTEPKLWDGYKAEEARGWYPQYVRVRFVRYPVDTSSGYSPYYFEDIALAAQDGTEGGTFVQIDDDLPALADSGTPSNAAALATRAAERAADWLRKRQYYDRPVLRAWRDFVPGASGLGAAAVREVIFDDRGGPFSTWGKAEPDAALEKWRPRAALPPWLNKIDGTACTGCGWLAGMGPARCLRVSVNGTATDLYLSVSDYTVNDQFWTSADLLSICGTDYVVTVDRQPTATPQLSLSTTGSGATSIAGQWNCCGCGYAKWTFNLQTLCPDEPDTGNPCTNVVEIRVDAADCGPPGGFSCAAGPVVALGQVMVGDNATALYWRMNVTGGVTYHAMVANTGILGVIHGDLLVPDCITPTTSTNMFTCPASTTACFTFTPAADGCLCIAMQATGPAAAPKPTVAIHAGACP